MSNQLPPTMSMMSTKSKGGNGKTYLVLLLVILIFLIYNNGGLKININSLQKFFAQVDQQPYQQQVLPPSVPQENVQTYQQPIQSPQQNFDSSGKTMVKIERFCTNGQDITTYTYSDNSLAQTINGNC